MGNLAVSKTTSSRHLSLELGSLLAVAMALVAVVAAGALISKALPAGASVWLLISCYMAPAGIAFAARWWMSQRD
jgi:hypothetical protein